MYNVYISGLYEQFVKLRKYHNLKYKEGNNRPPYVNLESVVHIHNKAGNKCYTQDNMDARKNQVCEYVRHVTSIITYSRYAI